MTQLPSERVFIFDTTLRDGEQAPGCSMDLHQKLAIAKTLKELAVDVIEAGFPISSLGDFEAVQAIAQKIEGPIICGLARCCDEDIMRAWEALRDAPRKRIHLFLATSAIHREYKLRLSKEQVIQRAIDSVRRALDYCDDVEFSAEDATRSEPDYLAEVLERAIESGARTVNLADTVGYAVPAQFADLIYFLKQHVRGIGSVVLGIHCHNDLGMAVANSLAALAAGARQVDCTVNGIGERAGNSSLEEIVMALKSRHDYFNLHTGINTRLLCQTSQLVSSICGMVVQRNKAIVGQNAFAHESGIHQHGVLMHYSTYEIMRPEDVGAHQTTFVMGKHSGRHAFRARLQEMGYSLTEDQFEESFRRFKALADKRKEIYDVDIKALVDANDSHEPSGWGLVSIYTSAESGGSVAARIRLQHADGRAIEESAYGEGTIDAISKVIGSISKLELTMKAYNVRSIFSGQDVTYEVNVEIEHGGKVVCGNASSNDINKASAHALLNAVNAIDLGRPISGQLWSQASITR